MAKTPQQRKVIRYIIDKLDNVSSVRYFERFTDCTYNPWKPFDYVGNFSMIKTIMEFKRFRSSHDRPDKYGNYYSFDSYYFIWNDDGSVKEIKYITNEETEKIKEFLINESEREKAYYFSFWKKYNNFKYSFGCYLRRLD